MIVGQSLSYRYKLISDIGAEVNLSILYS